jgi:nucleotide-binding universal stress UspA family protein
MYSRVLVALDGSKDATAGGRLAIELASRLGCELVASHIYDAGIHTTRFQEMEPVLPDKYQDRSYLDRLRDSHDGLINEGFQALSRGYMEEFLAAAAARGVPVSEVHKEGRNYVRLVEIASEQEAGLLILGATGLGRVADDGIGSTALRVLRKGSCDVLLARAEVTDGPVVVGIDGSEQSYGALRKAVFWSRSLGSSLRLAAAYDPAFHTNVFRTMAGSISKERQEQVGLAQQQTLHDQIIDDGLGKLYQTFLEQAREKAGTMGCDGATDLLQGKASHALARHAAAVGACLVVAGRYGHHREGISELGSNSEAIARLAPCHVLVTAAVDEPKQGRVGMAAEEMEWDEEPLSRFARIPSFAQPMARQAIEAHVRAQGRNRVTLEDFESLARKFGMGGHGGG